MLGLRADGSSCKQASDFDHIGLARLDRFLQDGRSGCGLFSKPSATYQGIVKKS